MGVIVGLIFIIIVILAVLISINERTKTTVGTSQYGGKEGIIGISIPDDSPENRQTGQNQPIVQRTDTSRAVTPQVIMPDTTPGQNVIILSPFQVSESYERARNIILGSQCYRLLGDVREITYYTGLVGQKFIAELIPSRDYSQFTAIIVVKLTDSKRYPVFYQEYPIKVDLGTNHVTECKGKPITLEDLMPVPYGGR